MQFSRVLAASKGTEQDILKAVAQSYVSSSQEIGRGVATMKD